MLPGFVRILTGPAQLTKDYFKPELGGLSASMLNTGLLSLICTALTLLPGTTVNGVTALAWFLTVGFGTFGMNPVNMLPLMLGAFVYARIRREPFAKYIHFAMFSTGVAPIITQVLLYYPDAAAGPRVTPLGVALALGVGIFVGCAMPGLCAHSPGFHKGYNLYNAGPAAGFLCFLLFAVLYKTLGVEAPVIEASLGEGHPVFVNAFCGTMFALCVIAGLIVNGGPGDYKKLLLDPGFRVDFTQKYSAGSVMMNLARLRPVYSAVLQPDRRDLHRPHHGRGVLHGVLLRHGRDAPERAADHAGLRADGPSAPPGARRPSP